MNSWRRSAETHSGWAADARGRASVRQPESCLDLWLIDHREFLTDARERENAVRRSSWPYHHQLESSGARSLIRSKDRPQTRRIKEGETSQIDYDPTGRGNIEDAAERIFDAADSRQVELAPRAQEQRAPLLLDCKLKTIC
jgi:hypothetical protein